MNLKTVHIAKIKRGNFVLRDCVRQIWRCPPEIEPNVPVGRHAHAVLDKEYFELPGLNVMAFEDIIPRNIGRP